MAAGGHLEKLDMTS